MDVEKQREIIRLWNRMRQVEGPVAEEIRIQILECFAQPTVERADERSAGGVESRAGSGPRRYIASASAATTQRFDGFAPRRG